MAEYTVSGRSGRNRRYKGRCDSSFFYILPTSTHARQRMPHRSTAANDAHRTLACGLSSEVGHITCSCRRFRIFADSVTSACRGGAL